MRDRAPGLRFSRPIMIAGRPSVGSVRERRIDRAAGSGPDAFSNMPPRGPEAAFPAVSLQVTTFSLLVASPSRAAETAFGERVDEECR